MVGEAGEAYDEDSALGLMQIRLTSTGEAIGGIGFVSAPDVDGSVEIGYGLAEPSRGHGYATEALEALVGVALANGATSVVATTAPENTSSQRVLERCGFVRDGEVDHGRGRPAPALGALRRRTVQSLPRRALAAATATSGSDASGR